MSWVAPRTWTAGEKPTTAQFNQDIRDNIAWLGSLGAAAWTAWTPTWTGTVTNPVIGNGTLAGVYMQTAKTVYGRFLCLAGSTTTFGSGVYAWALPVTTGAVGSTRPIASGVISDTGTAVFFTYAYPQTTTTMRTRTSTSALANATTTVPMTWADTDFMHVMLRYEAA